MKGVDPSVLPGYKATGTFTMNGNKHTISLEKGTIVIYLRI